MTKPIRVLYVDDNPLDRQMVRDALGQEVGGFVVHEASSRRELETRLAEGGYDLVLTDHSALGYEGLAVIDAVQAQDPLIPVILITGAGSEQLAVQAMKRGVADYLVKTPQHVQRLSQAIRAATETRRLQNERRLTEQAVREATQLCETALDHTYVQVACLNPRFDFILVNRAYAAADELEPSFFPGKNYFDLCPRPDDEEVFRRVVTTGEPYFAQASPLQYPDRAKAALSYRNWSLVPVTDQAGAVTGLVLTRVDVTERIAAEIQTREKTQDLALINSLNHAANQGATLSEIVELWSREIRRIFSCGGATAYLVSDDGKHLVVQNMALPQAVVDTIEKLTRVQVEGLRIPIQAGGWYERALKAGEPQITHDPAAIRAMMAECTTNKTLKRLVPRIFKLLRYGSVASVPLVSDGQAIGLLDMGRREPFGESDQARLSLIAEHMTALIRHRLVAEALERAYHQNELILNSAGEGILSLDAQGRITSVNPAAAAMLGWEAEEFRGRDYRQILPKSKPGGGAVPHGENPIQVTLRDGTAGHETLASFCRRDGSCFPVEYSSGAVREGARLAGAVVTFKDVTERVHAEAALRRSLDEAARAHRVLLALGQAARSMQRARTPDEVYRSIGDAVVELGNNATIFTLSDDRQYLTVAHLTLKPALVKAAEKLTGLSAERYRVRLVPGGFLDRSIASGKAAFSQLDVQPYAEALPRPLAPLAGRLAALLNWEQSIVAPLIISGKVQGLLIMTGTGLTEADVPAVAVFAERAAIAIENARLYAETDRLRAFNEGIIQNMAEGIVVQDAEGRFTFVNPAAAAMLGFAPQEMVGLHWTAVVPPDQQAIVRAADQRRSGGQTDRYGLTVTRKDGTRIPIRITGSPRYEDGQWVGSIAVFSDLTDWEQAQVALRDSEARFRELFQGVPAVCWTFDSQGTILDWNRAAAELYGWTAEQAVGRTMYQLMVREENLSATREVVAAVFRGESFHGLEYRDLRADGTECIVLVNEYPVRDAGGSVVMGICAELDITERMREAQSRAAVHALGQKPVRSRDVDEIAQSVVLAAQQMLRFPVSALWLIDERANSLVCWAQSPGPEPGEIPVFPLDRASGITTAVAVSGKPIYLPDVSQDPRYVDGGFGSRSEVCVPLKVGEQVVGVLNVESARLDALEPADLQLVESLASVAAIALANARLFEAIEHSEKRYRGIFEGVQDAILVENLSGRVLDVNQRACEMFGYTYDEFLTKTVADLVPPHEFALVPADMPDTELPERLIETVNIRANGEQFPIELSGQLSTLGDDSVLLVVVRDITERVQAREQLSALLSRVREQAEHLQEVLDTVPDGVLLLDREGRVLMANPAAIRDLAPLAGAGVGDALTGLGGRPLAELLTSPPHGNWHELAADGRDFELIARPVEKGVGAAGWVVVIRDVTQVRQQQLQIQRQERLAAVGQLAAGIAHDFNNIMAVIVLYAQMSQGLPDLPPLVADRLKLIGQQAQAATGLITQILDFSRSAVLERKPLDLALLAHEQVKLLERTLPESVRVTLVRGDDSYLVEADLTRMQQMIVNLAVNARDAMPAGGSLIITLSRLDEGEEGRCVTCGNVLAGPGGWVRLEVADNGTGIPEEVRKNIFEPFFTTKERGQGTGLGLAQVYGIVKQHDGHIEVESRLGEGSTFVVYLPALPSPAKPWAGYEPAGELPRGHGETVLVVEDNPAVRRSVVDCLEMLGYRILQAGDGQEALYVYAEHSQEIALVLSDLVMPRMGGRPMFHALRQSDLSLKVVLMTGHPLRDEMEDLVAEGLSGWIAKPPDLERIAQVLAQTLAGP